METRANYVLIGVCTLLAIILGLGFLVWLAKFQVDRQYAYYDVFFDNVSGLNRAAEVRFSGLTVGSVQSLDLSDNHEGQVRVRIEVAADTPITEGSTAQLQAQGVTGLSFVSITPGRSDAPLLRSATDEVPEIRGQRSVVQSLSEDAPNLLKESIALVKDFQNLVGGANQDRVASILSNADDASGKLQAALDDFSKITETVSQATGQISTFTDKLDPMAQSLDTALLQAGKTLNSVTAAFDQAQTTLTTADTTLKTFDGAAHGVSTLVNEQGADTINELKGTVTDLRASVAAISTQAKSVLASYGDTAGLVNARLVELQNTIDGLDTAIAGATTTMASVGTAATSVSTLVDGEGTGLVTDARATLASLDPAIAAVQQAATQDLPAMITEVRTALASVNSTIDQVSGDVTSFTGDLRPLIGKAGTTLDSASQTFRDASVTLGRLEPAISTAERTMTAAQGTFSSAERIINEDVSPTTASVRASAEQLNKAIDQVSSDLPAITAELKATLARATATVDGINAVVQRSSGPVGDFTAQGLPQFVRFTQQAQDLIQRLDRIAGQLERDPARFFLGAQAPDFRR